MSTTPRWFFRVGAFVVSSFAAVPGTAWAQVADAGIPAIPVPAPQVSQVDSAREAAAAANAALRMCRDELARLRAQRPPIAVGAVEEAYYRAAVRSSIRTMQRRIERMREVLGDAASADSVNRRFGELAARLAAMATAREVAGVIDRVNELDESIRDALEEIQRFQRRIERRVEVVERRAESVDTRQRAVERQVGSVEAWQQTAPRWSLEAGMTLHFRGGDGPTSAGGEIGTMWSGGFSPTLRGYLRVAGGAGTFAHGTALTGVLGVGLSYRPSASSGLEFMLGPIARTYIAPFGDTVTPGRTLYGFGAGVEAAVVVPLGDHTSFIGRLAAMNDTTWISDNARGEGVGVEAGISLRWTFGTVGGVGR